MGPYCLTSPGVVKLHTAATTGNGGLLLLRGQTARLTVVVQGDGTVSGGAVTIEEAYYDPTQGDPVYAGTWSAIGSAVTVTGSGAQTVIHAVGSFWAVRARISTNVAGGGSATVWAWGN